MEELNPKPNPKPNPNPHPYPNPHPNPNPHQEAMEELAPRADPGSREAQLEKRGAQTVRSLVITP